MSIGDLRNRFRQSKDYTHEMLIRDLIEYAEEIDTRFSALEVSGEWTPTLTFGGAAVGMTISAATGEFTLVGSRLSFSGDIQLTAKGSSVGSAVIAGLQHTLASSRVSGIISYATGMAWIAATTPMLLSAGQDILIRQVGAATTTTATDAHFTNTSRLIFSGNGLVVL
jgi:hypothetical protein